MFLHIASQLLALVSSPRMSVLSPCPVQLAALHYSAGEVSGLPIRTAFLIDPVDNTTYVCSWNPWFTNLVPGRWMLLCIDISG